MNTNEIRSGKPVRRVISASVVRRLHSDIARHKKSKKVLRRMKKEKDE